MIEKLFFTGIKHRRCHTLLGFLSTVERCLPGLTLYFGFLLEYFIFFFLESKLPWYLVLTLYFSTRKHACSWQELWLYLERNIEKICINSTATKKIYNSYWEYVFILFDILYMNIFISVSITWLNKTTRYNFIHKMIKGKKIC